MYYKMKSLTNILTFVLVVYTGLMWGQSYNKYCLYADYAAKAYKTDVEKAIMLMDSAFLMCPERSNNFENWFNYAMFNKELSKRTGDLNKREVALNALLRARGLDKDGEYLETVNKVIKSIANYYKNDAILAMQDTSSNFAGVLENYNKYKEVKKLAEPNTNFENEDIQMYGRLAELNLIKYKNNKDLYANYLDSSIKYYEKILTIDSTRAETYKELGLIYFNQAVDIVNSLDVEADIETLMATDEKKAYLGLKSIPYFEKAYELNPNDSRTIYALAGCYELISEPDKFQEYINLLKEKDPDFYNEAYKTSSN